MTAMSAANAARPRPQGRRPPRGAPGAGPQGRSPRRPRAAAAAVLAALALALAGCSTGHPGPIRGHDLAEAQTFPFFKLYWVGPRFDGHELAAVDGLKSYIP